jgi:hypothetical protein
VDGRRVGADCLLQVFAGGSFVGAKVNEFRSGKLKATIVPVVLHVTLPALDENFVLHPGGVGKLLNLVVVIPCHNGGGG